jgi:multicomponent Na+:H+ antiporter subunit C
MFLSLIIFILLFVSFRLLLLGGSFRAILGFTFLGNAVNLMIFSFTGLIQGKLPFIDPHQSALEKPYSDPLPQALILTAIVIGLGMVLFLSLLAQLESLEDQE